MKNPVLNFIVYDFDGPNAVVWSKNKNDASFKWTVVVGAYGKFETNATPNEKRSMNYLLKMLKLIK